MAYARHYLRNCCVLRFASERLSQSSNSLCTGCRGFSRYPWAERLRASDAMVRRSRSASSKSPSAYSRRAIDWFATGVANPQGMKHVCGALSRGPSAHGQVPWGKPGPTCPPLDPPSGGPRLSPGKRLILAPWRTALLLPSSPPAFGPLALDETVHPIHAFIASETKQSRTVERTSDRDCFVACGSSQ